MRRNGRRNSPAYDQMLERRRREDEAPRLQAEVPRLKKLQIEVSARRDGVLITESVYIRHVVVSSAPALIWIPCGDSRCSEGHDLTDELLRALRRSEARIIGTNACRGQVGTADCGRVLHYIAIADYA
jgi:hypothetical protein